MPGEEDWKQRPGGPGPNEDVRGPTVSSNFSPKEPAGFLKMNPLNREPHMILRIAGCAALLLTLGCAAPRPVYLERDVVRLVVLPPVTDVLDPDAWAAFWPALVEGAASRGYQVVSPHALESRFAGRLTPNQAAEVPPGDLARTFGAEGVLRARLTRCASAYLVAASEYRVEADFELLEARTGETLWAVHGAGRQQAFVEGNGWGALLGAAGVAKAALTPDPAGCWRRCVADAIGALPLAGRDPEPLAREAPKE